MKYIKASLLGLVQGITEFLPVSSSGHLMLLEKVGIGQHSLYFNIMLHLATLLSVIVFYRKQLWKLIKNPLQPKARFIVIATVPTALIALVVRLFIEEVGMRLLPFGFMATTILLVVGSLEWKGDRRLDNVSSFIIGVAQGVATIGGLSRSGSVMSTQMILGIDKEEAGEFTFLLSIPIIIASAFAEAVAFKGYEKVEILPLALAMGIAFLSGLGAIGICLRFIKRGSFIPFAIYTFMLSVLSLFVIY